MRRTSSQDRPWYIKKCCICQKQKHVLEFRGRGVSPGKPPTCKECEESQPMPRRPYLYGR